MTNMKKAIIFNILWMMIISLLATSAIAVEVAPRIFDTFQWMLGLFITIALFLLGIAVRILWDQRKQLAKIGTSRETQKDEISFLKNLIEKLLPPKGVL